MDSQDYICAFSINGAGDIPADFGLPPEASDFVAGIFLPQSEFDSLRRRACPARILLLTSYALWVIPHSQSKEPRLLIKLRDIETLECGRILLLGWIGLHWAGVQQGDLRYNRRCSLTIERFLSTLKALWLASEENEPEVKVPSQGDYGAAVSEKFEYALDTEMIAGEGRPAIRFFQPSIRRARRRFFRYKTWSAGDLIVLSRRRVLWITERRGTAYEPYGTVSHSAPLAALLDVDCCRVANVPQLRVRLRSGHSWRLPLDNGNEADAQSFADAIRKALSVSRGNELLTALRIQERQPRKPLPKGQGQRL